MQQLNLAWNVLPAAFKVRSISVLINFSLEKIINDILELLDISIEEVSLFVFFLPFCYRLLSFLKKKTRNI
jgi:hypothetical protein